MTISTGNVGVDNKSGAAVVYTPPGGTIPLPPPVGTPAPITVEWGPQILLNDGDPIPIGMTYLITGGTATVAGTIGVRVVTITGASPS